jgi:hypothetical protein
VPRQTEPDGGDREFLAFVEHVPELLEELVEEIRDEWDGSPLLVITSGQDAVDAFILTGTGEERLEAIVGAFAESASVPEAAALMLSSPLVTSRGLEPGRAVLTVFCADAAAREEWLFGQLGAGPTGAAEITELPDDVDVQMLPSATTDLVRDLLVGCAKVPDGSELDPRSFEPLLEEAKATLHGRARATPGRSFISDAMSALEHDLLNNMFGWSGEPCVVQWSGQHQMISPGILQGETAAEQLDAMRQLFEMDLPSSVLIARLVAGEPADGVLAITVLDDLGDRTTCRARVTSDPGDVVRLTGRVQEEVELDDLETGARELLKVSARVRSGEVDPESDEWRRTVASVEPDT